EYKEKDDSFELQSLFRELELAQFGPFRIKVSAARGIYRVTRTGNLRSIFADAAIEIQIAGLKEPLQATFTFVGDVHGNLFVPEGYVTIQNLKEKLALE